MTKNQTHCERLRDLVSSVPERAATLPSQLAQHAESCAACQVEVRASERLTELLRSADRGVEPGVDAQELVNRVLATRPKKAERPSLGRFWVLAPAAAAALMVVGGWMYLHRPAGSSKHSVTAEGLAATSCERSRGLGGWEKVACTSSGEVNTARGERARITLSDSTTLWLNHNSKLRIRQDHRRGLWLERGEALLHVVRQGELPPLTVRVPTGVIQVVGTQLQITARARAAIVDVLRGKVIVHSGGRSEPVTAGGEAVLTADEAPLVQAAADLGTATEWADGPKLANNGTSGFGSLRARRPGKTKDTEQALRLLEHKVTVRIQGRVARTEVEEVFHNDSSHTLEGFYKFPLPADAKIAALDLVVDGKWMHGAIVDRARGDKIWRGVIRNATPKTKRHQPKTEYIWVPGPWHDPALLKWKQGSEFELKIFPIPKRGARRVRIAYTQILRAIPGGRRYVLPLAADPSGRPRAERFRFEARIGGLKNAAEVRVSPYALSEKTDKGGVLLSTDRTQFAPTGDIVLDIPSARLGQELSAFAYKSPKRAGDGYALLSLRPALPAWSRRDPLKVLFVVDSSYSIQKTRLQRAAELVARVTRELDAKSQVHVLACAAQCRTLGPGFRAANGRVADELLRSIATLEPLGSTRLTHALQRAAQVLAQGPATAQGRVIYLGDGVPTVGEIEPARLSAGAKLALGNARLTTVSLGGQVDEVVLRGLAQAGGGSYVRHGAGVSMRATAFRVLQRQWGEPLREVAITLPKGVHRVAPEKLGELWPGEERLLAARLPGDAEGEVVLRGVLAGRAYERKFRVSLKPRAVGGNAFLPRLWAERRIADLEQRQGEEHRKTIVKLSKSHHVLSRHTSLLVLESTAMAKAFKVQDTRPPTEWTGDEAAKEEDVATVKPLEHQFAPMSSKARSPSPRRAALKSLFSEDRKAGGASSAMERPLRRSRRWWGRRRMIRMKKVWYRVADVGRPGVVWTYEQNELRRRKQRLDENPRSRDRTKDLVRWYVRMGDLAAAEGLAKKWLAKDRMDADALAELAGIAALQGDPDRSRDLLASAVDVDPRSAAAHSRMVELYRAAGNRALMCAHALTRALVDKRSWHHQVAAARCDQDLTRHLAQLEGWRRQRAEKAVAKPERVDRLWGRLMVTASWDSGADLDIVVVTPQGRVVSWQGGARRVVSEGVRSLLRETLASSMTYRGRYQVYVVPRAHGKSTATSGTVRIRSYNSVKTYPFAASTRPVRIADVNVKSKFRLVRAP
ncbi:MAG: FecR domain-containing protein [bacterium]